MFRALTAFRFIISLASEHVEIRVCDDHAADPSICPVAVVDEWPGAVALLEELVTATAVLAYSNTAARRAMLTAWPEQLLPIALR